MGRRPTGSIVEHDGVDGLTYRSLRFSAYGRRHYLALGAVSREDAEGALRGVMADVEEGTWRPPKAPSRRSKPIPLFQRMTKRLRAARLSPVPVMALRRSVIRDAMDDVVVKDVVMFRAEQLDSGLLWLACYFRNGDRVTFNVHADRKNELTYDMGEEPAEWVDLDA